MKQYCLDTSVLIEGWVRRYPIANFPSFWQKMEEAIAENILISSFFVHEELKRKNDELFEWAGKQEGFFIDPVGEVQLEQAAIVNRYPKMVGDGNKSLGDPWVIALARCMRGTVVTEEAFGNENKPKIPFICREMGIECIDVVELIAALGWVF